MKIIMPNQLIPELSVTQLEKSLEFYVDIIGFNIVYQRNEEGFAFLELGKAQLMLDEIGKGRTWETGELHYPLGRGINFQITVENVDALAIKLKQHQINLFLEIEEKWYKKNNLDIGNKQFLVMDPDGYLLRFNEDLGARL